MLLLAPQRKPAKDGTEQRAAASVEEACAVMGIDWMSEWDEVREAIPPAYTELIGHQLMQHIRTSEKTVLAARGETT